MTFYNRYTKKSINPSTEVSDLENGNRFASEFQTEDRPWCMKLLDRAFVLFQRVTLLIIYFIVLLNKQSYV